MLYQIFLFTLGIYIGQEYQGIPNMKMVAKVGIKEIKRYIDTHDTSLNRKWYNLW